MWYFSKCLSGVFYINMLFRKLIRKVLNLVSVHGQWVSIPMHISRFFNLLLVATHCSAKVVLESLKYWPTSYKKVPRGWICKGLLCCCSIQVQEEKAQFYSQRSVSFFFYLFSLVWPLSSFYQSTFTSAALMSVFFLSFDALSHKTESTFEAYSSKCNDFKPH